MHMFPVQQKYSDLESPKTETKTPLAMLVDKVSIFGDVRRGMSLQFDDALLQPVCQCQSNSKMTGPSDSRSEYKYISGYTAALKVIKYRQKKGNEKRSATWCRYHMRSRSPFGPSRYSAFSCCAIAWAETISASRFSRGVWSPERQTSASLL